METTEDLINLINSIDIDYTKNNVLVLFSKYKTRSRNIIKPGVVEHDVMKDVDGEIIKVKETDSVENFVTQFIKDVDPLHLFRVTILIRNEESNTWQTCLDEKPITRWK